MRRAALATLILLASCVRPTIEAPPPTAPAMPAAPPPASVANPAVGGVAIPADRPIGDGIGGAPSLTLLANALAVAGLLDTLRGAGPLTLFAPTNEAWSRLRPNTADALMKPENRPTLVKLLGLHLVRERLTGAELMARIAAGDGRATLTSVAGEPIAVTLTSGILTLTDAGGNRSYVEVADVRQANGMVHVVNGVLVPRLDQSPSSPRP